MKNFNWFKTFVVTTLAAFALVVTSCDSLDGDLMMDYPQPTTTTTYTVTFNSNGGSWVDAQQIDANDTAMVPTTIWIGYDLVGWYTDSAFTTEFNILTTPITADIMLYAKWEVSPIIYYNVIYMDGATVLSTVPTEENTAAEKPADNPTGGAFIGWFADEALTTEYDFTTPITAETTIYAKLWADTKTDFEISTVSEFLAFRDIVNTAATGTFTVKLMDNIDMTDVSSDWMPIGRGTSANLVTTYFSGTFDGNGKTISNFTYDTSSGTGNNFLGLFGVVSGTTTFKDLTIKDANVNVSGMTGVGILIGNVGGDLTISNCTIDGGSVGSTNRLGSFVGNSTISGCSITIENCTSSATVAAIAAGAGYGGLIGYTHTNVGTTINITNSSFTGTVSGGATGHGGLIGQVADTSVGSTLNITNSYSTGSVSATTASIGGLVGLIGTQAVATIIGSYSTGDVGGGTGNTGGIIGSDNNGGATVTSCYSASALSGSGTIGGIAGSSSAGIFTSNYFLTGTATNGVGSTSSDTGAAPVADLNSVVSDMNASMPATCSYEYVAGATSPTLTAK